MYIDKSSMHGASEFQINQARHTQMLVSGSLFVQPSKPKIPFEKCYPPNLPLNIPFDTGNINSRGRKVDH